MESFLFSFQFTKNTKIPLSFTKSRVVTHFFKCFSRFLKVHIFGSIFSFKLISIKETVLNRIKTFKRFCKVTLNVFFNKKNF